MPRKELTDDAEDTLFRVFEASQGLQRRVYRIVTRGHANVHAIEELRQQLKGIHADVEAIAEFVADE